VSTTRKSEVLRLPGDADGIVGPQTWKRLFSPDAAPSEDE
jgi:hypothetical protein